MRPDQPNSDQPVPDPVVAAGRFILAGIGLASLIGEELLGWLQQRAAEASSTTAVRPPHLSQLPLKVSQQAQAELNRQLNRRGLFTHADLQALLKQMTELEKQIDQIAAQHQSKD